MNSIQIKQYYWKFYESIGFERTGLFECLRNEFGDGSVLYPGSSSHISHFFVFSNVIYVDRSEVSEDVLGDEAVMVEFVELKKNTVVDQASDFVTCTRILFCNENGILIDVMVLGGHGAC